MTVKQVIVIRKDLKMRTGKIAAQAAHASMKVLLDQAEINNGRGTLTISSINKDMEEWLRGPFTKICVYVNSEDELDTIYSAAWKAGLPVAMVVDAGKTEFNGVPTKTCIAIGPAQAQKIDTITGSLKLL